jgi:hypothetical protein
MPSACIAISPSCQLGGIKIIGVFYRSVMQIKKTGLCQTHSRGFRGTSVMISTIKQFKQITDEIYMQSLVFGFAIGR